MFIIPCGIFFRACFHLIDVPAVCVVPKSDIARVVAKQTVVESAVVGRAPFDYKLLKGAKPSAKPIHVTHCRLVTKQTPILRR